MSLPPGDHTYLPERDRRLIASLLIVMALIGLTALGLWSQAKPAKVVAVASPTPSSTGALDTATPPQPVTGTSAPSPTATHPLSTTVAPTASATPSPTGTPTARPRRAPTLGQPGIDLSVTPVTEVPTAAPEIRLDKSIVNILLMGRDVTAANTSSGYRTDVIIIASINKDAGSVTLLTIPRDLFVWIPGWTMQRINTAAGHGDYIKYPGGGPALLEQTILYNLGISIHYWVRVDFDGFKKVVNTVGGIDVPVSCAIQDWRLKKPSLDPQDETNWRLYTLWAGVKHMDGDLALWYSRTRKLTGGDFDRSRRQHQVLRAIFDKAISLEALSHIPELYSQYTEFVDTDMQLGDVLQFVPLAAQLDRSKIKSRFIGPGYVIGWRTPVGASVLLPRPDAIASLLAEAFVPPSQNRAVREAPTVEISNGTAWDDLDDLAADNLEWSGIRPVLIPADRQDYPTTIIYDYSTSKKGSALKVLQRMFKVKNENVISQPDPEAPYKLQVILGDDYRYHTCLYNIPFPKPTPTPLPTDEPTAPAETPTP
ncbi:MAG: LCP family protein [Chloroflexi bacterium]|nr:LCP family protein [Chloroflexota bacterium]